jgi:thiamine monophosphate synthase
MIQLKIGLVQSAHKYHSEATFLQSAASALQQASETNTHEIAVDNAVEIARRVEALGLAIDSVADGLTPEIERLTALTELTQRT